MGLGDRNLLFSLDGVHFQRSRCLSIIKPFTVNGSQLTVDEKKK